jgi:hypothetical protein
MEQEPLVIEIYRVDTGYRETNPYTPQDERKCMDVARRASQSLGPGIFVNVLRGNHRLRCYENGQR